MSFVRSNEEKIDRIESSSDLAVSCSASLCGGGSTVRKDLECIERRTTNFSSSGEEARRL